MSTFPAPSKPLKVLTIDGGGLQAIPSLLILNKLLDTIAHNNNNVKEAKPRPCDVFDVICGIGSGGWLAIMLGRFRMDITAALAEWYNLIECIKPQSTQEEMIMRLMKRSYYDRQRLVEQVDEMTDMYDAGKFMYLPPSEDCRCKHVFVAALKASSKDENLNYGLFRTYDTPSDRRLLDGFSDPRHCMISDAFSATGAAKWFTPPWKGKNGKFKFQDTHFPSPHNITDLAVNEVWGLYGNQVAMSIIVNIGPGLPNAADIKHIARRFSWGSSAVNISTSLARRHNNVDKGHAEAINTSNMPMDVTSNDPLKARTTCATNHTSSPTSPTDTQGMTKKTSSTRYDSFGSEKDLQQEKKLRFREDEIENKVRTKLRNVYQASAPPYYRLAPPTSPLGSAQNDTAVPRRALKTTEAYLAQGPVGGIMEEASRLIDYSVAVQA